MRWNRNKICISPKPWTDHVAPILRRTGTWWRGMFSISSRTSASSKKSRKYSYLRSILFLGYLLLVTWAPQASFRPRQFSGCRLAESQYKPVNVQGNESKGYRILRYPDLRNILIIWVNGENATGVYFAEDVIRRNATRIVTKDNTLLICTESIKVWFRCYWMEHF